MTDPRIAIIGAGHLATRRIYPYIGAAGAELVGVCDLDADRAARNARRFGGRPYANLHAMLDAEQPDGVILCIGPQEHAEIAPVILRRGFPLYTEKPPSSTAAQALEIARISHETGTFCMTAFKKRYALAYNRAKEWIGSFPPEDVYSISADYCSGHMANDSDRTSYLLDFAIHMIDLIGYLMGDVQEVFAFHKDRHAYVVSLRFRSGALGSLNLNDARSYSVPTEEVEISIRGGNAMTIHNSSCWRIMEKEKPCEWREPLTFISAGDSGYDTGHLAEIEAFVRALREGGTTRSAIYESYKSIVLYEAIQQSAEEGRIVEVQYAVL
jgi:predicted dehydrogenase